MRASVRWVERAMFVGESGSGHGVVIEGPPEQGGREVGIRPMELMLLGLGGCMSFDVVDILRKGRARIED